MKHLFPESRCACFLLHLKKCISILLFIIFLIFIPATGQSQEPEIEYLQIKKGWNWISFPRLNRSFGDPSPEDVFEQDNFDQGYTELELTHLQVNENVEVMTSVVWNQQMFWQYTGLNNVYSEKGYKLRLAPEIDRSLSLTGTVLNPLSPIPVFSEKHNWIGYFLQNPQNPFDAIPQAITDNLYSIISQYWWCYNYALIAPDPAKSAINSNAEWRCACNQYKMELNYGDMVILHSKEDQSFTWNHFGISANLPIKDAPENFIFQEQSDYCAYFIEVDTNDPPDEIGAFAGDSCIGATKVLPGDSTVLICGYDEGFEGEEISFQTLYITKSTKPVFADYMVQNIQTGIMEKSRIIAGDLHPYYFISLKQGNEYETSPSDAWISIFPNPAKQTVSLTYSIPDFGRVIISINGIIGDELYCENRGYQTPGEYKFNMDCNKFPAGYYLVTLHYNHKTISDKLLILKKD